MNLNADKKVKIITLFHKLNIKVCFTSSAKYFNMNNLVNPSD